MAEEEDSILTKLDSIAPIHKFDAFPKVPASYRGRSTGGGLWTLLVAVISVLLVMNDVSEYLWGWPDSEFAVDKMVAKTMILNVDLIVNMPCHYLSVDLRDAVGERLHLSSGFRRDGTIFDTSQGQELQLWQVDRYYQARAAVALARKNRGFFAWFYDRPEKRPWPPTYNYRPDGSACRVYGSIEVKKVTANLHITTLGHGYGGNEHTDHSMMNLSHIITEFSFGPYIPDIVQPLDYTFEVTKEPFSVFQYFVTVVPTTYHASGRTVRTNQYSVTHYVKTIQHGQGAPGIFFKYDVDPMAIAVHQRTTFFHDFFIRVIGIVGGVWVCASWAFKIGGKAAQVVTGAKDDDGMGMSLEARSTARKSRWNGGSLNKRPVSARWDDVPGSAISVSSPGWNSASFGGGSATPTPTSTGFPPPSPYTHNIRSPSGQWNVPPGMSPISTSSPSGFANPSLPSSPLPSPYAPTFPRSVSGLTAAANIPIPPSPGGALSPGLAPPYSPGGRPSSGSWGRSSSSLNPNRTSSRPMSYAGEKKEL